MQVYSYRCVELKQQLGGELARVSREQVDLTWVKMRGGCKMLNMEISTISDSGLNRFNSVFEDTIYTVACVTDCISFNID